MIKFSSFLVACSLIIFGCSKKEQSKPLQQVSIIKISLLSGENQTSAIGNPLNDSIVVKVTKNGSPLNNATVQFTGSGCNSDLSVQLNTKTDGTAKYLWRLAANQGPQILSVVALAGNTKADSVIVHATATSQYGSNLISACTPYNSEPLNIVSLSTGRLLSCFRGKTSLRYSDDNGVSWNPIKTLGANHDIFAVATSPQDEIFAATCGDGIFYSKDSGATWVDITPSNFNKSEFPNDMAYTNGTLIFIGGSNDVFTSSDKGKTWISSVAGLAPNLGYYFPCRLNNGDLYVMSLESILFKSIDGGINWSSQNTNTDYLLAIDVDNNGWFYKSIFSNSNGGFSLVYISKDNGQTFSILYSVRGLVNNMSILADGFMYYSDFFNLSKIYNIIDNQTQYPQNNNLTQQMAKVDANPSKRSFLINQNRLLYISGGLIRY